MAAATTALLIGAGIAAAGQVAAAKISSNAAKNAGNIQAGSANDAKGELRPIYEGNLARMQPYASLGGDALGQLRALGGYPAAAAPTGPLGPITGQQGPMNMSDPRVQALARGGSLADPGMSGSPLGSIGGGGTSAYGGAQPQGGSFGGQMVALIAPNGEQGQVPANQAEAYIARGARRA